MKNLYSEKFFNYLTTEYKEFQYYEPNRQRKIFNLIIRPIGHPDSYQHNIREDSFYMKAKDLRKVFGNNYIEELKRFFYRSSPSYDIGPDKNRKSTMAYKFQPKLREVIRSYKNDGKNRLIDDTGKYINQIPQNTIYSLDKSNKRKSVSKIKLNNYIPINYKNLLKLIEFVEYVLETGDSKLYNDKLNPKHYKTLDKIESIYIYLKGIKDISNNNLSDIPGLIVTYEEGKAGRLFSNTMFNPQNMPSEIRNVIFAGMGYYDYDIENTNYMILMSLYDYFQKLAKDINSRKVIKRIRHKYFNRKIKIPNTPLVKLTEYINSKKFYRDSLSKSLNLDVATVKQILISFTFCAKLKDPEDRFNGCETRDQIIEKYNRLKYWKSSIF